MTNEEIQTQVLVGLILDQTVDQTVDLMDLADLLADLQIDLDQKVIAIDILSTLTRKCISTQQ